jgi:DNA-binding GntR family transcriptional regulator
VSTESPPRSLQRRGASELLASELRREILHGNLRPNDPLREADIASRYAVARNTVREALRLLTRDGLAVHTVHRSVTVRQFEPQEVREVFEVRRLFEEAVAERAGSLTDQETARLEAALEESERAFERDDVRSGLTAVLEFHRLLVALLGNARIDEMFEQLLGEVRLILRDHESRSGGPWIGKTRELLDLLRDGDSRGYREKIRTYIGAACEDALAGPNGAL